MQAVLETFEQNMDTAEVMRLLDTKNHPDHLSGLKSKAALLRDFRDAMASDEVMWPAFAAYHRSVAACLPDGQFDLMVRLFHCMTALYATSLFRQRSHASSSSLCQVT